MRRSILLFALLALLAVSVFAADTDKQKLSDQEHQRPGDYHHEKKHWHLDQANLLKDQMRELEQLEQTLDKASSLAGNIHSESGAWSDVEKAVGGVPRPEIIQIVEPHASSPIKPKSFKPKVKKVTKPKVTKPKVIKSKQDDFSDVADLAQQLVTKAADKLATPKSPKPTKPIKPTQSSSPRHIVGGKRGRSTRDRDVEDRDEGQQVHRTTRQRLAVARRLVKRLPEIQRSLRAAQAALKAAQRAGNKDAVTRARVALSRAQARVASAQAAKAHVRAHRAKARVHRARRALAKAKQSGDLNRIARAVKDLQYARKRASLWNVRVQKSKEQASKAREAFKS